MGTHTGVDAQSNQYSVSCMYILPIAVIMGCVTTPHNDRIIATWESAILIMTKITMLHYFNQHMFC